MRLPVEGTVSIKLHVSRNSNLLAFCATLIYMLQFHATTNVSFDDMLCPVKDNN